MVPSEEIGPLALYLEKQRELRRISEELEQLKSNRTIEAAMRIKHEIDALLADYELTPEQLLEALCTLFDLAKPYGYEGNGLDRGPAPGKGEKPTDSSGSRASQPKSIQKDAAGQNGTGKGAKGDRQKRRASGQAAGTTNTALVPPRKVTISSKRGKKSLSESPSPGQPTAASVESSPKKQAQPSTKASAGKSAAPVSRRQTKVYTNPHTGEVVRTRGSNHRILNEWRREYGPEVVDEWWVTEGGD